MEYGFEVLLSTELSRNGVIAFEPNPKTRPEQQNALYTSRNGRPWLRQHAHSCFGRATHTAVSEYSLRSPYAGNSLQAISKSFQ